MSSSSSGPSQSSAADAATTTSLAGAASSADSSSAPAAAPSSTTPMSSQAAASAAPSTTTPSSTAAGDAALSGTASLPWATATTVIDDSKLIECPSQNETVFQDPTTGKQFLLLCGRDYSSLDGDGAIDIVSYEEDTMNDCIEKCASTFNCSAAGWGNYYNVNTCWLKSQIGVPNWSPSWYFAIEVGQASSPTGLSGGAKAGIAVGAVAGVVGLGALAVALWWKRRQRRRSRPTPAMREREPLDSTAKPPGKSHEVEGDNPTHPHPRPYRHGGVILPPHYAGSSEALYAIQPGFGVPGSSSGMSGSNLQTPITPRGEKGALEWDWQGMAKPQIQTVDAELPTREGYRYGPEYEIMTQEPGTKQRPHQQWGAEAAEQKFLLQDMASAKQQQRRNTEAAESSRAAAREKGSQASSPTPDSPESGSGERDDGDEKRQSARYELP